MNIVKISTLDKKEVNISLFIEDGLFNLELVPKTYNITFICDICGKEASKRKGNLKNNNLVCGVCQRKQTNLEKYGVEVSTQSKEILEKRKNNNIYKYGVSSPSSLESVKEKAKQTNLEKYGVETSTQSKEILEKRKNNNIEKYGVDSPRKLESVKEKAKQTNLKKYGVENPFGSKQIKEKIKQTNLEKYGVEYPGQSKDVKEKIKQTNLEKYGVEYYFQSSIFLKGNHNKSKERFFKNLKVFSFDNLVEPLFDINEYYGVKEKGSVIDYKWKCKKCNNIFYDNIYAGKIPRCQKCFPTNESVSEVELRDFISQYIYVESHNRKIIKPYEIDILIPERKIAIEFNGLYWHSEINGKHKNYHLNKQKLAKEKGYDLIHVFENEWINKKDIVSSILLSRLNIYNEVIYARKTVIKPVSIKERREFLNANHLQGDIGSSLQYGLYYNGILVSVVTFGKPRFNKRYNWELLRSASKKNTKVIGGFSKLLKYFLNNYNGNIITYSDKRYFNGNVYENNGFEYLKTSKPNYFYFKKNNLNLESRNKYQKHKLKNIFENYDDNLTEYENMLYNNYNRIWDCGNKVYILNR